MFQEISTMSDNFNETQGKDFQFNQSFAKISEDNFADFQLVSEMSTPDLVQVA